MKICYCAGAIGIDDKTAAFIISIPADTFSRYDFVSVFEELSNRVALHYSPSGKAYLTHFAFGRTENDAMRKLDNLGWREYAMENGKHMPKNLPDQASEQLPNRRPNCPVQSESYFHPIFLDNPFWERQPRH
ncbi:MAG: hypothetical protein AABX14_05160 [Candidatus Aenigmatarchaeota archaeon]